MATIVKVCLVGILLQLTFILGTEGKSLELNADPTYNGGTLIKALPGGMSLVLGKGLIKVKGYIKHAGKYYDDSTGKELATDPFHSVDQGNFIVADCGYRVFQLEGDMEKVSATPAATEGAPTPAPVVVQPEERTLQEKEGMYTDKATGTTVKALFNRLSLAKVSSSGKGNLMRVESTTPVDNPQCPTLEQINTYFKELSVSLSQRK